MRTQGGFGVVTAGWQDELYYWMPLGRRVSGMMVDPSPQAIGSRLMRGFPVGGASTSSSMVTP